MKKIILITSLILLFTACNTQDKKLVSIEETQIEKVLKKQIFAGYSIKKAGNNSFRPYKYGEKDMEVCASLSEEKLSSAGYKFPSNEEFREKIKKIFKVDLEQQNSICFLVENNKPRKNLIYQINSVNIHSTNLPIFVNYNKKILLEPLFIPELIDYKNEFPEILKEENEILTKVKGKNDEELTRIKWKDVPLLKDMVAINNKRLINRNKFLFNNDMESFKWLQYYDKNFLESLVKVFGYTEHEDLLKWVFESTILVGRNHQDNVKEYNKLFFTITSDNTFKIHKETLEYIRKNPKKQYLEDLYKYKNIIKEDKQKYNLNFEQRAMIEAYIIYYGESTVRENIELSSYKNRFVIGFKNENEKYTQEFIKNDYYGLLGLKELWEQRVL